MNRLGVRVGAMGVLSAGAGAAGMWGLMRWAEARSWVGLLIGAGLTVVAAAAMGRFCRRTTRALRDLEDAARQVGAGDLRVRLPGGGLAEVGGAAAAFAQMAADLAGERGRCEEASHRLREGAERQMAAAQECSRALESLRRGHRDLRRWVLSIQGLASLLARDCGRRLDASGREYLEGIRADAAAMEAHLRGLAAEPLGEAEGEAGSDSVEDGAREEPGL